MSRSTAPSISSSRPGDAAVDGLLAGLIAGAAMLALLLAGGLVAGDPLSALLGRFDLGGQGAALNGLLAYLAVSAIYGLIYGLLLRWLGRWTNRAGVGWLAGIAYGLILFGLAQNASLVEINLQAEFGWLLFLAAHLVYGAVLGRLARR